MTVFADLYSATSRPLARGRSRVRITPTSDPRTVVLGVGAPEGHGAAYPVGPDDAHGIAAALATVLDHEQRIALARDLVRGTGLAVARADDLRLGAAGAIDTDRRDDNSPCPVCGGDRLRLDFTGSRRCHVPRPGPPEEAP